MKKHTSYPGYCRCFSFTVRIVRINYIDYFVILGDIFFVRVSIYGTSRVFSLWRTTGKVFYGSGIL